MSDLSISFSLYSSCRLLSFFIQSACGYILCKQDPFNSVPCMLLTFVHFLHIIVIFFVVVVSLLIFGCMRVRGSFLKRTYTECIHLPIQFVSFVISLISMHIPSTCNLPFFHSYNYCLAVLRTMWLYIINLWPRFILCAILLATSMLYIVYEYVCVRILCQWRLHTNSSIFRYTVKNY